MRTKILVLALFVCINVFAQSDLEQLQLQYEQAVIQTQEITNRNNIKIEKLKIKQEQLLEKLAHKQQTLETAKPLKAKSLNKQIEKLTIEVSQLQSKIEEYENEIAMYKQGEDSIKLAIDELTSKQQAEDSVRLARQNEEEELQREQIVPIIIVSKEENQLVVANEPDSTKSKNSSNNESDENDGIVALWFVILTIIVIIYKIIKWVRWRKCPHCKKRWALKVIDEQDLGTVKKEKVMKSDGSHEWVYYRKIKVTRECKYCGNQVWHIETRKEA